MIYACTSSPVALIEYKDAVSWYKIRSKNVAENFVFNVNEQVNSICENPRRYRNNHKYFRETSLGKYPYCIIYFVDEI